jgi:hypothetical protein
MRIHTCDKAEDVSDLTAGDMIKAHEEDRTCGGHKTYKGSLAAGAPPVAIGGCTEGGLAGRADDRIHGKGRVMG